MEKKIDACRQVGAREEKKNKERPYVCTVDCGAGTITNSMTS